MTTNASTAHTIWRRGILLLCAVALAHCGGEVPATPPAQLALSPSGPQIAAETGQQFSLRGMYSDGSVRDLTTAAAWRVADSSGREVPMAADGFLQLDQPGRYVVTALYGDSSVQTPIIVTTATVQSVAVSPSAPSVSKGSSQAFTATASFSDGTTQDVTKLATWAVKDVTGTGVATIDTTGVLQAKSIGKAAITTRYKSHSASTTVTVTAATLTALFVSPADPRIASGTSQRFTASGTYSDGTTVDLTSMATWAVSDLTGTGVAAIDGTGNATGKAVGTAQISADFGGLTGQTTLTVTPAVAVSIAISPSSGSIAKGTTQRFTATATLTDGTTQDVTATTAWTATDKSGSGVASIDSSGVATGNAEGTATISGAYHGNTASALLTVTPAVLRGLSVNPSSASISQGQYVSLTAIGVYSDGSSQDLSATAAWAASDVTGTDIASVGAGGRVFGKNVGRARIAATVGEYSASATVDVNVAMYTALVVSPSFTLGITGSTSTFSAVATLTDGTTKDVSTLAKWTVADVSGTGVASVDSKGVATALTTGIAQITASFGGYTSSGQLFVLF